LQNNYSKNREVEKKKELAVAVAGDR